MSPGNENEHKECNMILELDDARSNLNFSFDIQTAGDEIYSEFGTAVNILQKRGRDVP